MKLDFLNDKQKEAVLYKDGPLMILAGAGSGKTRVISTKIYYLIEECKVDPYNILAITFTNKAANEMKERTELMLGRVVDNLIISTFHSLGLRILMYHYEKLGYSSNFVIMDTSDSLGIIRTILKGMKLDTKEYPPGELLKRISSYKNNQAKVETDELFLTIYEEYEKTLRSNNSVDFDDLILLPVYLFNDHPEVLEYYQNRFKYILIDEFQDTNDIQYQFAKALAGKHRNLTCVGDIDQSIYSFRAANYENVFMLEEDFPELKTIKLEQNYRSTKNILNASNSLIKHNEKRKEKNLWADSDDGDKVYHFRAYNEDNEADFIMKEIIKLQSQGVDNKEIAVLYRNNILSRNIEQAFKINKISYKVFGGVGFYDRKEIKLVSAYLKFIYNNKDNASLERIINFPKRGIGEKSLEKLNEKAIEEDKSIYEAIESGKELEFKNLIEELKTSFEEMTVPEMYEELLDKIDLINEYENSNDIRDHNRIESLEEFKSVVVKNSGDEKGLEALGKFLLTTSLVNEVDDDEASFDRVNLMTIHSSKGCEFDYVFVIGLEDTILPSIMDGADIEEERRLLYVAITRARKKVYLITTLSRVQYGKSLMRGPSRFIEEIDEDYIDFSYRKEEKKIDIEEMYNEEIVDFSEGDNVHHKIFGRGKVIRLIDDKLIEVKFVYQKETKIIMKQHKDLVKY